MDARLALLLRLKVTTLGTALLAAGAVAALVAVATGPLRRAHGPLAPALVAAAVLSAGALLFAATPRLLDAYHRHLGARELSPPALRRELPAVAAALDRLCAAHALPPPRVLLLDAPAAQAYCYGHRASRLVLTRGLLRALDASEVEAVLGHEVGHLVHRDTSLMTAGAAVLSLLWWAHLATRSSRGRALWPFSLLALALWWLTRFALLAMSRAREYAADAFAAAHSSPGSLASALRKVSADSEARSLDGALGILGFARSGDEASLAEPPGLSARAFELHSPWARLAELSSTHPRLSARLAALEGRGGQAAALPGVRLARLYLPFAADLLAQLSPAVAAAGAGLYAWARVPWAGFFTIEVVAGAGLLGLGAALLPRSLYALARRGPAGSTTVAELLADPYASAVRGRLVRLQGQLSGPVRASGLCGAGQVFRDASGAGILLRVTSPRALLSGASLLSSSGADDGEVVALFRRGSLAVLDLASESGPLGAPRLRWAVALAVALAALGAALVGRGASALGRAGLL